MALQGTRKLTVDLVGIAGMDTPGISVSVALKEPRLVYPFGTPHETLYPTPLLKKTNDEGVVEFDLLPSGGTPAVGNYVVTIGSYEREITMPDADARLSDLLQESPAPTPPGTTYLFDDARNLASDLTDDEKAAIRQKIGAGTGEGAALSADQLADLADAGNRASTGERVAANQNRVRETNGVGKPVWAAKTPVPVKAVNADVDGEADDGKFMTVAKTFRAIGRRVKNASTTVRGIVLVARNEDVDVTETDATRVLTVASAKRLIARIGDAVARTAAATARQEAAAAQSTADENAGELDHLGEEVQAQNYLMRDLHLVENEGTWVTATDATIFVRRAAQDRNPRTGDFTSATGSASSNSQGNSDHTRVQVKLPTSADTDIYRLKVTAHGRTFYRYHSLWLAYTADQAPNDADYYAAFDALIVDDYTFELEKRSEAVDKTEYDGVFAGTFKDRIVAIYTEGRDPTAQDGKDTDLWYRIHGTTEQVDIWEKISGTWVRLFRADKNTLPDPPAGASGAKKYELNIAADGTATWVEAAASGGQTSYELPQATESARGGVQGATSAQATANSGTTILGWTNSRIRQLIQAALPTIVQSVAAAGTSNTRAAWTALRVRQAINAVVPAVFRTGNADRIASAKLGSGAADQHVVLAGDGAWQSRGRIWRVDWGSIALGTTFKVGDQVKRFTQWFVCEVEHNKGGTGPDNDPTNWSPLNNFAGPYDEDAWYHAGTQVLYGGRVVTAKADVVPSDPVPDHDDNTKWDWRDHNLQAWTVAWTNEADSASSFADQGGVVIATVTLAGLSPHRPYEFAFNGMIELTDRDGNDRGNNFRIDVELPDGTTEHIAAVNANRLNAAETRVRTDDSHVVSFWPETPSVQIKLKASAQRNNGVDFVMKAGAELLIEQALASGEAVYPGLRRALTAGKGIALDYDDEDAQIAIEGTYEPSPEVPAPPKHAGTFWGRTTANLLDVAEEVSLRQLASHDTRVDHGPYDYKFTYPRTVTSGHGVDNLNSWNEIFPTNPEDYDATKPGFVRDGGDHQWNANGVEFTNTNDRRIRLTANIKTDNANRRLGDTMELRFSSGGRVKLVPVDAPASHDAVTTHQFTFFSHQAGGEDADHSFQFDAVFTDAPRSGVHDWFKMHLDFDFQDGAEYFTPELVVAVPEEGHIPTQKYRSNGWHSDPISHLDLRPASDYRLWTFDAPGVGQSAALTDNQTLALVALDSTGGFLTAARDLRRVAINIKPYVAKNLSIGDGYIDIWTDVPDLVAPKRLKRVRLSSSEWDTDAGVTVTAEGLLEGQRIYVTTNDTVNSASNQGGVEIKWDANLFAGAPPDTVIVAGLIDTVASEIDASANVHTIGAVDAFPFPRDWQTVRIFANGVISTFPWPLGLDTLPGAPGGPQADRPAIGPVTIRTQSGTGAIAGGYYAQFYEAGGNLMVNFRGSNGGQEPHAYVEKIEIDYRV